MNAPQYDDDFDMPPSPPIEAYEGRRPSSKRAQVGSEDGADWILPIVDTNAWVGRIPPARRWIVDGWLARATGGALFGEDGIGKSLLAQQLATCVAAGRPFLGLDVTHVGAMYITCEDDELSLWQRQRAINKALGLPLDCAPAMLSTLAGHVAAQLGDFDEAGTFQPGPMFHAVARRAESISAGLIVLDNIAHLFPGNEIVRRQVVGFLAAVDKLALQCDAAVLLLGHPAKAIGSEYSGNLGWSAHVRQRWFLGWGDPELNDPDTRILRKAKANLGKKGEEVAFRWHEWAFVRDEDLGNDTARELAAAAAAGYDNEVFMACLRERNRQRLPVSQSKESHTFAPKEFVGMPEAKGLTQERLTAAFHRLMRLGRIERGFLWREDGKDKRGLREVSADLPDDPADLAE